MTRDRTGSSPATHVIDALDPGAEDASAIVDALVREGLADRTDIIRMGEAGANARRPRRVVPRAAWSHRRLAARLASCGASDTVCWSLSAAAAARRAGAGRPVVMLQEAPPRNPGVIALRGIRALLRDATPMAWRTDVVAGWAALLGPNTVRHVPEPTLSARDLRAALDRRGHIREAWGVAGDARVLCNVGSPADCQAASRLAYHVCVLAISGAPLWGVVSPASPDIGDAIAFLDGHDIADRLIVTDAPLLDRCAAADIGLSLRDRWAAHAKSRRRPSTAWGDIVAQAFGMPVVRETHEALVEDQTWAVAAGDRLAISRTLASIMQTEPPPSRDAIDASPGMDAFARALRGPNA